MRNFLFCANVAKRYILSKNKDSFVAVMSILAWLGLTLGITTLIVVLSVMNGFRQELVKRILGLNGHITLYQQRDGGFSDEQAQEVRRWILAKPHVRYINLMHEKQGLAIAKGQVIGCTMRGVSVKQLACKSTIRLSQGAYPAQPNEILLGQLLAERLRLEVGDTMALMIPEGKATVIGVLPRKKTFTISGMFQSGMHEYDRHMVFMGLTTAQDFFHTSHVAGAIEVFLDNPDRYTTQTMQEIKRDPKLFVGAIDWQHMNASFFETLTIERNIMFIIVAMIVLVAAFNIISGMMLLVRDKAKEIAILRTIGVSAQNIQSIFWMVGGAIGLCGVSAGALCGTLVARYLSDIHRVIERLTGRSLFKGEVYFLTKLPSQVNADDVLIVCILGLVLTMVAAYYPARRAAQTPPVEGLQNAS